MYFRRKKFYQKSGKKFFFWNTFMVVDWKISFTFRSCIHVLNVERKLSKEKFNHRERKIWSYKPTLMYQVNMKKSINYHQSWMTIHPPHEAMSHHWPPQSTIKKAFQDWLSPHLPPHVPLYKWGGRRWELWKFSVNLEIAFLRYYINLAVMKILGYF